MTPRGSYRDGLEKHLDQTRKHARRIDERLGELGQGRNPRAGLGRGRGSPTARGRDRCRGLGAVRARRRALHGRCRRRRGQAARPGARGVRIPRGLPRPGHRRGRGPVRGDRVLGRAPMSTQPNRELARDAPACSHAPIATLTTPRRRQHPADTVTVMTQRDSRRKWRSLSARRRAPRRNSRPRGLAGRGCSAARCLAGVLMLPTPRRSPAEEAGAHQRVTTDADSRSGSVRSDPLGRPSACVAGSARATSPVCARPGGDRLAPVQPVQDQRGRTARVCRRGGLAVPAAASRASVSASSR
jgi:hypothetical protein